MEKNRQLDIQVDRRRSLPWGYLVLSIYLANNMTYRADLRRTGTCLPCWRRPCTPWGRSSHPHRTSLGTTKSKNLIIRAANRYFQPLSPAYNSISLWNLQPMTDLQTSVLIPGLNSLDLDILKSRSSCGLQNISLSNLSKSPCYRRPRAGAGWRGGSRWSGWGWSSWCSTGRAAAAGCWWPCRGLVTLTLGQGTPPVLFKNVQLYF